MSSEQAGAAQVWAATSEVLRERVSSVDFYSWFAMAEPVALDADELVLGFANDFAARYVGEHFAPVLAQAASDVTGHELRVRLVSRETPATATPAAPVAATPAAAGGMVDAGRESGVETMTEAELAAELAGEATPAGAAPPVAAGLARVKSTIGDGAADSAQPLNDRYRFDTFVIGEGNQLAHAAALSVAEAPGQAYNPLYIYGGTGLGKTHLLHAIGHYAMETRPGISVAYVSAEHFISRLVLAIQNKQGMGRFKEYYRGVDLLLIDDVQFVGGKGSFAQEELFYTFNALQGAGNQIVLTSDCEPSRIPRLEDRLRTRFAWGLITDISVPDHATRVAILRKRAISEGFAIDEQVLDEIAQRITTNVRELEGALTRVIGLASLTGKTISAGLARSVLDSYVTADVGGPITIERIQEIVCEHFSVTREDLLSDRKSRDVALPRQIAMYLARTLMNVPQTQIGRSFGRDHTTVRHAATKIDTLIRSDREVYDLVEQLTSSIRSQGTGVQHAR